MLSFQSLKRGLLDQREAHSCIHISVYLLGDEHTFSILRVRNLTLLSRMLILLRPKYYHDLLAFTLVACDHKSEANIAHSVE